MFVFSYRVPFIHIFTWLNLWIFRWLGPINIVVCVKYGIVQKVAISDALNLQDTSLLTSTVVAERIASQLNSLALAYL
jgi:hypothetical protein